MVLFSSHEFRCYCFAEALRPANRDQRGIDDLPTAGFQPLGTQVLLKPFKKIIDNTRLAEPLAEKAMVVASGMVFITPRPTNSSNERLSMTWNSISSSLRLKSR